MANSLRAKLSKLRHNGHITDAEYQALIKKLDGHDKEIRRNVIDEFAERLKDFIAKNVEDAEVSNDLCCEIFQSEIDEIAEQMKVGAV